MVFSVFFNSGTEQIAFLLPAIGNTCTMGLAIARYIVIVKVARLPCFLSQNPVWVNPYTD